MYRRCWRNREGRLCSWKWRIFEGLSNRARVRLACYKLTLEDLWRLGWSWVAGNGLKIQKLTMNETLDQGRGEEDGREK